MLQAETQFAKSTYLYNRDLLSSPSKKKAFVKKEVMLTIFLAQNAIPE